MRPLAWATGNMGMGVLPTKDDPSGRANRECEDVCGVFGSAGEGSGQRYKHGNLPMCQVSQSQDTDGATKGASTSSKEHQPRDEVLGTPTAQGGDPAKTKPAVAVSSSAGRPSTSGDLNATRRKFFKRRGLSSSKYT